MVASFTLGTQFEVDANGGLARVAGLTDTTAIVLFSSSASGIEARFVTNSGGTLTGGTVLTIDANNADSITICRLSDTTAVIGYCYGATHESRVLSVSGTTITAASATSMTDTGVDYLSCELLDTNKVIYSYVDSTADGIARILSVSGTTITENALFNYDNSGICAHTAIDIINTSTAIVAYGRNTSLAPPRAQVLDVSGTTITGNSDLAAGTTFMTASGHSSLDISSSPTDTDYSYVVYRTVGNAILLSIMINSGGTLSKDSTLTLESSDATNTFNCSSVAAIKAGAGADPGYDIIVSISNNDFQGYHEVHEYDAWNGDVGTDTSLTTTNAADCHIRLFPGTNIAIVAWNDTTEAIIVDISGVFSGYALVLGGGQA